MTQFKILDVQNKGPGGPPYNNNRFELILEEVGSGAITSSVYLGQKPETAFPVDGQILTGEILDGEYGPKFKKEYNPQAAGGGGGGGFKGGGGKPNPERERSIIRQHSQEMAIRYAALQVGVPIKNLKDLKVLIDYFEHDATHVDQATHPTPESMGHNAENLREVDSPPSQPFTPPSAPADDDIPF
jgi:hypothetical protein